MKIEDPTVVYSTVVTRRRRSRATASGDSFRLGLHGLDCGATSQETGRTSVIGASAWALKAEQVERSVEIIGIVGGLLADLGFHVCPIGADANRRLRPSIVVWVCGDETEAEAEADEYRQLAAIGAPGLSIGSCVDGLDGWGFLEFEQLQEHDDFLRLVVDQVAALLGEDPRSLQERAAREWSAGYQSRDVDREITQR